MFYFLNKHKVYTILNQLLGRLPAHQGTLQGDAAAADTSLIEILTEMRGNANGPTRAKNDKRTVVQPSKAVADVINDENEENMKPTSSEIMKAVVPNSIQIQIPTIMIPMKTSMMYH